LYPTLIESHATSVEGLECVQRSRAGLNEIVKLHVGAIVVLAALTAVLGAVPAAVVSPSFRRKAPRHLGLLVLGALAAFLGERGIDEFWVVDYSDAASYQHAWGGPSLAGVLAVDSGPGLAIVAAASVWLRRRWRTRRTTAQQR
jgi:hypothetical protein